MSQRPFLSPQPTIAAHTHTHTTNSLRLGEPLAALPLLHHALLGFSRHVRARALDAGLALAPRTDAGFVDGALRFARGHLGVATRLAPAQFLARGFAELKVLLLWDVAAAARAVHAAGAKGARRARRAAAEAAAAAAAAGTPAAARRVGPPQARVERALAAAPTTAESPAAAAGADGGCNGSADARSSLLEVRMAAPAPMMQRPRGGSLAEAAAAAAARRPAAAAAAVAAAPRVVAAADAREDPWRLEGSASPRPASADRDGGRASSGGGARGGGRDEPEGADDGDGGFCVYSVLASAPSPGGGGAAVRSERGPHEAAASPGTFGSGGSSDGGSSWNYSWEGSSNGSRLSPAAAAGGSGGGAWRCGSAPVAFEQPPPQRGADCAPAPPVSRADLGAVAAIGPSPQHPELQQQQQQQQQPLAAVAAAPGSTDAGAPLQRVLELCEGLAARLDAAEARIAADGAAARREREALRARATVLEARLRAAEALLQLGGCGGAGGGAGAAVIPESPRAQARAPSPQAARRLASGPAAPREPSLAAFGAPPPAFADAAASPPRHHAALLYAQPPGRTAAVPPPPLGVARRKAAAVAACAPGRGALGDVWGPRAPDQRWLPHGDGLGAAAEGAAAAEEDAAAAEAVAAHFPAAGAHSSAFAPAVAAAISGRLWCGAASPPRPRPAGSRRPGAPGEAGGAPGSAGAAPTSAPVPTSASPHELAERLAARHDEARALLRRMQEARRRGASVGGSVEAAVF